MYREIQLMNIVGNYYLVGAFIYIICVYSGLLYLTIINPYSNHYNLVIQILWIPLQIIFMMVIWSLMRCIVSDPGKVPIYWGYFLDDSERDKKKIYCLTCHIFKPDRCHHCKTCKRCVLNMDHHCPWIGNCIGYQNRKFFILFLLYTNLAVLFSIIILFLRIYPLLIDIIYHDFTLIINFKVVLTMLLAIIICVFGYIIGEFLIYHINLVSTNKTTLEILSLQRNQSEQIITNYFDLGIKKNWLSVMGTNPWLWPFPMFGESGRPLGDGVKWERNQALITVTQQNVTNRTLTNQNQGNELPSQQRI